MSNTPTSNDLSIAAFVDALASADATHRAVSAAAVAGAMGVSLLVRSALIPPLHRLSTDSREQLQEAAHELHEIRSHFLAAIETETAAKVLAARSMPRANAQQRAERDAVLQLALIAAAEVPLELMRLSVLGLEHAGTVAAHVVQPVQYDLQAGIELLSTTLHVARTNLEEKLSSLTEVVYARAVVDEIASLAVRGSHAAAKAESFLKRPQA
jgi:formiminotetrahydrofolate cyclodeaminase